MVAVAVAAAARDTCCHEEPCVYVQQGIGQWQLPDGSISTVCPARLVTPLSAEILHWYRMYQKGVLPVSGGWLEQAAPFVDAMNMLDSLGDQTDGSQ